jgi:hypothetical protein
MSDVLFNRRGRREGQWRVNHREHRVHRGPQPRTAETAKEYAVGAGPRARPAHTGDWLALRFGYWNSSFITPTLSATP